MSTAEGYLGRVGFQRGRGVVLECAVARDWLSEFWRVAEQLAAHGFAAERAVLADTVEASATGTELAVRARYHLRQLAADERLDATLRNAVRELAELVNATLEQQRDG